MGNVTEVEYSRAIKLHFNGKFTEAEVERLLRNFRALDEDGDGFLQKEEFMRIESLQQNPLVSRVLEIFDSDSNNCIDFTEFVRALSIFTASEEKNAKMMFAFKIYDVNSDGFISNGDLFQILKIMVGDNLNSTQLQQLVDRTILQADKDKDGRLSPQEFSDFIEGLDIENKLVIDLNMAGQM